MTAYFSTSLKLSLRKCKVYIIRVSFFFFGFCKHWCEYILFNCRQRTFWCNQKGFIQMQHFTLFIAYLSTFITLLRCKAEEKWCSILILYNSFFFKLNKICAKLARNLSLNDTWIWTRFFLFRNQSLFIQFTKKLQ